MACSTDDGPLPPPHEHLEQFILRRNHKSFGFSVHVEGAVAGDHLRNDHLQSISRSPSAQNSCSGLAQSPQEVVSAHRCIGFAIEPSKHRTLRSLVAPFDVNQRVWKIRVMEKVSVNCILSSFAVLGADS